MFAEEICRRLERYCSQLALRIEPCVRTRSISLSSMRHESGPHSHWPGPHLLGLALPWWGAITASSTVDKA